MPSIRYQISRGDDDDVNIDIVFGPGSANNNRSVIIDNKDYNYTLVITGQDFQILQHDTHRNVTYQHGIRVGQFGNVSNRQSKV